MAFALSAGSRCPVVVVRGDSATPGPGRPVVVGVDGSSGARVALDTAADLAASWGADLTVLAAWHLAAVNSWAIACGAEMAQGVDRVTDIEREAEKMANRAAGRARARQPGLHVTTVVEALPPAPALVSASHGAGLVVVGNRGRGRVAGLLLGSVSHATIHGASCPVAVVRSDSR